MSLDQAILQWIVDDYDIPDENPENSRRKWEEK